MGTALKDLGIVLANWAVMAWWTLAAIVLLFTEGNIVSRIMVVFACLWSVRGLWLSQNAGITTGKQETADA